MMLLTGCSDGGVEESLANDQRDVVTVVNDGPEGDSGLVINSIQYPLDAALGDIWGIDGEHYRIDFTLTDGNFTIGSVTVDGQVLQQVVPAEAGVVFHARMFSAGTSFDYSSYAYLDTENNPAGVGYFNDAFVGLDTNGNGRVETSEQIEVLDGIIDFVGALPDIELRLNVTLNDGQTVTGHYTGLFDFTPR